MTRRVPYSAGVSQLSTLGTQLINTEMSLQTIPQSSPTCYYFILLYFNLLTKQTFSYSQILVNTLNLLLNTVYLNLFNHISFHGTFLKKFVFGNSKLRYYLYLLSTSYTVKYNKKVYVIIKVFLIPVQDTWKLKVNLNILLPSIYFYYTNKF